MRISTHERQSIRDTARNCFGEKTRVILFGSRADDSRRGGDIDLYIVAGDPEKATLKDEFRFLNELEVLIGEQKVDVVLRRESDALKAIDEIARSNGILL